MVNHPQPIQVTQPQLMDISPSSKVETPQGVSNSFLRLEPIVEQEKSNRSQEVCKNKTMTNKEFGEHLEELSNKVLLPYAMTLTAKDLNAAKDLCQTTLLKVIKHKETYLQHEKPKAYAKRVLRNAFFDQYRKRTIRLTNERRDPEIMDIPSDGYEFDKNGYPINKDNKKVLKNAYLNTESSKTTVASIDSNNIVIGQPGNQQASHSHDELITCLQKHDETDQTILSLLAVGNTYKEIQEVLEDFSENNIRVKAMRARKTLAECIGKNYG
jgi:RNA polymerase sigma factor (sigma-70 family)